MELSTLAFVIGREDFGESDVVLSLYTKDLGKIKVSVRGYKKMTSKLRPSLLLFSKSYASLHTTQAQSFLATGAEAIERHRAIMRNPLALKYVLIVAVLIDKLFHEPEEDLAFFAALEQYFAGMEQAAARGDRQGLATLTLLFLVRVAGALGIQPKFDQRLGIEQALDSIIRYLRTTSHSD